MAHILYISWYQIYIENQPFDIQIIKLQMQEQQVEHAIKLIGVDPDGKYTLSPEGIDFIRQIKPPIAVISVAGMYRTGKSYLLNRMLLNRSNGFGVGPTVNPCTKGLWCWGKPIMGKTPEGDSVNVIVIDTEGIGALDEDQTHDTRIFTLAILAASSFIYNSTGSIDQNALQNLSLVVNLTKNIQLNSHKSEDQEDDPEDLAEYFPAFYWVVRDFSLMLMNSQGDTITSKEYLEKALAPQKGFSDDIEEKNRIRRLLTSFFRDRDCITLVRPLVNEQKLQYLDTLDMDELRPQFVDQVMNLRRRILGRIRPKTFKGKQLDGQMYLCMLNSYLNAINNGAVPSIQNAWSYMCQEKCAQAFEESLDLFNSQVESNLMNSIPIEAQFLLDQLHEFKQKACDLFEKKAVGDNTKFHLKQLRNKFEQKIQNIKHENQVQSENVLRNYFKKSITGIENKLRVNEYQKFDEFMKQLNDFYRGLCQNGPNLPKRDLVYLQLLRKVIPTAAEIFLKNKNENLEKIKSLAEEKEKTLMSCIEKLKADSKEAEEENKQKISKLDRQKIDLQLQLEEMKKMNEELKESFNEEKGILQTQISQNVEEAKKKSEQLCSKIANYEQKIAKLENNIVNMTCQRDKEDAIKQMKFSQLKIELQEMKKRNNQQEVSLKNLEFQKTDEIKEISLACEEKIKNKDVQLKQYKKNLKEVEEELANLRSQFQLSREEKDQIIQNLEKQLGEKSSSLEQALMDIQKMKKQIQRTNQQEIYQLKKISEEAQSKIIELEKQLKNNSEEIIAKENKFLTEKALLEQKLQFTKSEGNQYKNQLAKQKEEYDERIQRLLDDESTKIKNSQELIDQLNGYQIEIATLQKEKQRIENEFENYKEQILEQINTLKNQCDTTKNKLVKEEQKYQKIIQQYEEKISEQLSMKGTELESYEADWKKKEKTYLDKIELLEEQMEENKEQFEREQSEEREKSEQVVLQLKNYYELERQKLEAKLNSEKEKYDKKIRDLKGQFDEQLKDETLDLQNQIQMLKERFFKSEQDFLNEQNNKKIELEIKNKNIENLQKYNEQLRSKLQTKQGELTQRISKIEKEHQAEKEVIHAKVEQLMTKNSRLEKEKATLMHSKDQQKKLIQNKEEIIAQLKEEMTDLKRRAEEGQKEAKNIKNQMSTKLMEQKVQFTKKLALLQQENQYQKKKIEQYEKSQSNVQNDYEEKYKKLKDDLRSQVKSTKQKAQMELEAAEEKYQKLKKISKEKEATQQKTISTIEKDLAISNQKIINLTEKVKFYEEKNSNESEKYSGQILDLKASFLKEKEQLKEKLQMQMKEKEKMQTEKNNLIAANQQEIALLTNKNKFLEEGRERYKSEYEDTKNKLETIIEGNRKKWINEKSLMETSHNQYISKIEKKYSQEKQGLIDSQKRVEQELEKKIKHMEQQIKNLTEKVALDEQSKNGEQIVSDRRVKEMEANEKKLQSELQKIKNQRESQGQQIQTLEKQKQSLKQKLKEKEQKYRQIEKKKQHMFYEIEKQKAKWNMQKENYTVKYDEQKDMINKLERDIQRLQRDNEKMKMQKKCQRTSFNSMGRYSNNFSIDKGHSSRSSFQDSILKENNSSQISDTSLFFKE